MKDLDARILHISSPGTRVATNGGNLEVKSRGGEHRWLAPERFAHLSLHGGVQMTTSAMGWLADQGRSVSLQTGGGRLRALVIPGLGFGLDARRAQHRAADDADRCQALATAIIGGKLANQRALLDRYPDTEAAKARLLRCHKRAMASSDSAKLRGFEGDAARVYFGAIARLSQSAAQPGFAITRRVRRPPTDPTNALLSFCYGLLSTQMTGALWRAGLDPFLGLFHQPRAGRPALALDVMEPLRPAFVDTFVLQLILERTLDATGDFQFTDGACRLSDTGRRTLLNAWEQFLSGPCQDPTGDDQVTRRRIIERQAQALAAALKNGTRFCPHQSL